MSVKLDTLNIGVETPKVFNFSNMDEAIEACSGFNFDEQGLVLKYEKDGLWQFRYVLQILPVETSTYWNGAETYEADTYGAILKIRVNGDETVQQS